MARQDLIPFLRATARAWVSLLEVGDILFVLPPWYWNISKHLKEFFAQPMTTGKIVKDFLPGPEGLSFRKERVLTLRLGEPTIAELKEVADHKGLGMSTLVRMWVRERLAGST